MRRYWTKKYHDQTAMERVLAVRGELQALVAGTRREKSRHPPAAPFHSWQGGPELRLSEHVAVLPHAAVNSNRAAEASPDAGRGTLSQNLSKTPFWRRQTSLWPV